MPDEKDIDQLLAILRDERQTPEARKDALRQLMARETEVKAHLREDFKPAASNSAEADLAYQQLQQQIHPARVMPIRRWLSIAAAIIIGVGAVWFFMKKESKKPELAVVAPAVLPVDHYDTISNTISSTAFHRLPDGTTVHLETNSYLYFKDSFAVDKKEIFLHGSALFTVNKEAKRPFSVFVNGLEVLDLGTVFSITSKASTVKVKLIQGKVLVRSASIKDIALTPGQEFTLDTTTRQFAVLNTTRAQETKLSKQLVFKNTPLIEVFETIEKECHVTLTYDKHYLLEYAFTGTFEAGSSARNMIAMVCTINDLYYELRNNEIIIGP